ncbi:DUF402 domain-containing protein [soil metagenome]
MPSQQITVNSRKYDKTIRRSWKCELVECRGQSLVFRGVFASDIEHPDLGLIKCGTISLEYYWLDRWYSIFRFDEPDGAFRNYYCNINMPPIFADGVLDYVDLDVDIVVWPDQSYQVLDLDEFEQNADLFGYPDEIRTKVTKTLIELKDLIACDGLPGSD